MLNLKLPIKEGIIATSIVSRSAPIVNENSPIRIDFLNEETPIVSSLDVAHHFQKKHRNVLRDIETTCAQLPEIFVKLNFEPKERQVKVGMGMMRTVTYYSLTRDAFSLLVMGFTGTAALKWKIKYIEAFNALEAALRENIRADALAEARQHPALEADRKVAYLGGMKEGAKIQKRQDRLTRLLRIRTYLAKGLTHSEIGKILGVTRQAVTDTLARARKAGLCA